MTNLEILTANSTIGARSPLDPSEMASRLKKLRLPTVRASAMSLAEQAAKENWSHLEYLNELTILECRTRNENRIQRRLKTSELERNKTWEQIDWSRMPRPIRQRMDLLRQGEFLTQACNVLIFGRPGSGKTLLLNALGDSLVRAGHTVCFAPCVKLVQHLLAAKRDLKLPQLLSKLGKFTALIIDDLGYVQQSREEMEVLFSLIADRYERTSILLSSNLPFSKWESIFKDPMTTAAAIDRLVHHSVILELNVPSFRLDHAKQQKEAQNHELAS